jgi:hypothetical protein
MTLRVCHQGVHPNRQLLTTCRSWWQDAPQPELGIPPPQEMVGPEFATSMEEDSDRLDAFHGDTPVCYRRVDNILGEAGSVPGRVERVMARA